MLMVLAMSIGNVWGADPDVAYEYDNSGISNFHKTYNDGEDDILTISSTISSVNQDGTHYYSADISSSMDASSTALSQCLDITTIGATIDSVAFLISRNSSSKAVVPVIVGYDVTAFTAQKPSTAPVYIVQQSCSSTNTKYSDAVWMKFDVHDEGLKKIRLVKQFKKVACTIGSDTYVSGNTYFSGAQTFRLWGVKVWLHNSCTAPTSLNNGETTSTSQAVTWTAGGTELAWEVLHQAKGATVPAANATPDATVTSDSYTFTGLTPSTAYDWYVRAKCGDSDKSSWVKGTSFTTSSAPSANPVITGAVNEDGWGTVSDAITVTANSTIAISDNVLTCDEKTLTATAADATAEYTYAFSSWSGVTNGQSVTANVTATANFSRTPVNYTLAWNSNGGSELSGTYTSGTVAYGAEITKPANPTRPGYTFVGWAESTTGEAVVVPATMPAANKAYYAKWDEITCPTEGTVYSLLLKNDVENVSLVMNGGTLNLTSTHVTVTNGVSALIKNTDTGNDGKMQIKNQQFYFNGNNAYLKIVMQCALAAGDEIEMTGGKDSREFYITPNECAKPSVDADAVKTSGYKYTVKATDTKLIGVSTLYIGRDGSSTYTTGVTVTRPEQFDITYWKNDGTDTKTEVQGTAIAENAFSREGYRFIEWNTQADGEGDKVNVGAEVTADTEVFAIWAQEFSVSYANTGAASGAAPTNENKYLANETFKVAGVGSMVAAENYVFGGWNDGTAIYQEDDDYTVTGTVSFVPVWNLQYTVTYKANGGTGDDIVANNPAKIADCVFETPENKLFDKWNESPEGEGVNYAVGADVATSLVLYAIWKDDECTTNRKSIFKAVMTGDATATVTGENGKEYAGEVLLNKLGGSDSNRNTDATIAGVGSGLTTYKMNGTGAYMYGTLKKGAFQEGDKIQFAVSSTPGTLAIYGAKSSDLSQRVHIADMPAPNAAKVFTYTLTAANAAALAGYDAIGIYRADGVTMNPYMYSVEITGCRAWTIQYSVTFDLNGQSGTAPEAQSIEEGGLVTKPADPEADGQFFRGWYKEAACTNAWDFANDVVTANTTLYAKWEADPCTDKKSIVRVVMTGANAASSAGYNNDEYAGEVVLSGVGGTPEAAEVDANHDGNENGYKLSGGGSCVFAQLKKGVFQEGDVVKVTITKINDNYKVNNVAQQILDIYYGSSSSDAALLATISNVDAAGTYSYRLTATDVTTIGDKKCIGIYRPSSGRVQNQYVYSVEVSGCREWTAYHTLTFAKADETVVAAPALAEGVYASTVAPKAPRVSSHHFLGWSTTKNDADAIVNLAEYTITEDKTLYAVYAENDCSGNGLMFSQVAKANTLSEDYSLSGTTEESIGEYATVTGGEVYLNNNSSNTRVKITKTTSAIQLTGGDEGYIHVLLDCPLKEKDTIKVDNTNKWVIAHNASKTDKVSLVSSVHFFIVPAEWEGKDEFYIWRDGSSCNISTIQVIRPVLYTVSFDMMEHGSAIAALTGVPENGKITAPTAPTADNYSFGGWYKEEACTNAWDFENDVVTENTTLYAKWLHLYTVSFDMMEHGSAIAVLMDVPENSKITAPNVPTDENYYFEGWYKENTLENEWNFASDVVTDNTILYAKWNDKSDATLKSLRYGDTEIALEVGEFTYNVNLSPLATTVPALTAETNNPNATKQITNGTLDEEGHAQSTVVVTPEKAGAATQTYTVNFTKVHLYTELVDVTGPTTWNWSGLVDQEINDVDNRGVILANYIVGDNFEKMEGKAGEYASRNQQGGVYQGTYLHFHTTVPGKVAITCRAIHETVKITINDVVVEAAKNNAMATTTPFFVPAGDVTIVFKNNSTGEYATEFSRIQKVVFSTTPDYTRDQMLGNGVYGTLCVDHNVPVAGINGATFYELQGRENTYGKLVFDEVVSGELTAGKPYVFQAHGDIFTLFFGTTKVDDPVNDNGMYGTFEQIVLTELNDIYYFAQRALWSCDGAIDLTIPANRAYVKLSEIDYLPANDQPAPGRRRVTMAVNGEKVATGVGEIEASETPMKVMIDGQLFIIRGEKMFDATGRLVK